MSPRPSHRQAVQGFTLIEIMIALTIGLLLILGVSQLFLSNREGYRLQSGMARLQENARFAIDWLRRDIGMAGFPSGVVSPGIMNTSADGAGAASDILVVQYRAATDCLGQATPAGTAVNTYTIAVINDVSNLMCTGNGGAVPVALPLVEGIDNLQVLYGVDTDLIPDGYANRYMTASSGPAWASVVSVRFAVLVNSVERLQDTPDGGIYNLLNAPPIGPLGGMVRRQVFTSTVPLRNAVRSSL